VGGRREARSGVRSVSPRRTRPARGAGVNLALVVCLAGAPAAAAEVTLLRVPAGGIQPRAATDGAGTLHLVYYVGDPMGGDLFYVRSSDDGATFSSPVRVNSQPGSAIAAGTIRGASLALGRAGRVHVAWNGTTRARPRGVLDPEKAADDPQNGVPMLYSRLGDSGAGFEPQRSLMRRSFGLDGGGSVAADASGNVYVAWHARGVGSPPGEAGRGVWVAVSRDDGESFSDEIPAGSQSDGACGCCGLGAFADAGGRLYVLYRTARELTHRDVHLLVAAGAGRPFREAGVDAWDVDACPMSSVAFAEGAGDVLGAWQTQEQIYFAALDPEAPARGERIAAPGTASRRKYPSLARGPSGLTLLVWAEGAGWKTSGSLAWQIFDRAGAPVGSPERGPSLPDWSFGTALARGDGGFAIFY